MNAKAIEISQDNSVVVVRFVRPEVRNPLSGSVLEQLNDLIRSLDSHVRALIFTGTGNVFASGADLREIANVSKDSAGEFAVRGQELMKAIANLPQLTVAAINGYCFGGALDLALACNYRIASPEAHFSHPGVGLGIITGWGGTQRLPRLIGEAAALEMFLTAGRFRAEDALRSGLIDEIAADPLAVSLAKAGH
jgi:enoyl-CoA hydratase